MNRTAVTQPLIKLVRDQAPHRGKEKKNRRFLFFSLKLIFFLLFPQMWSLAPGLIDINYIE